MQLTVQAMHKDRLSRHRLKRIGSVNRSVKTIMQELRGNKRISKPLQFYMPYRDYADQTLALNRMRGMLEDEMTDKRTRMMKEM